MSTPKMKNVNVFDPRPFHLANNGGLTGFGIGNALNSNIKAELKVPIASYDNRKMLFSSGYGSEAKEFMRSCDRKKSRTMRLTDRTWLNLCSKRLISEIV